MVVPYTLMNLAKHGYWSFFGFFGLLYLTDFAGIGPKIAGTIMLVSLVFDALMDIAAGALIERWRSQLRDYQPIILGGVAVCALSMALYFSTHVLGAGLVVLVLALMMFRIGFTVYDLCDNALASRITPLQDQRTVLSAWRKAAAALASMAVGASAGLILADESAAQTRLPLFALIVAVLAFVCAMTGYRALRALDRAAPHLAPVSALSRTRGLLQTPDAFVLAGLALVEAAATLTMTGGLIFFARAAFDDAGWAGSAIIVFTLAQIATLPAWTWAAQRFGKHATLSLSHGLTAIACAGFASFAPASPLSAWIAIGGVGAALSGVSTLRWSIAPDLMDRAHPGGVRLETSIAGLLSGAVQVGAGLSAAGLGWLLALHGYQADRPASLDPSQLAGSLGMVAAVGHGACAAMALHWSFMQRKAQPV